MVRRIFVFLVFLLSVVYPVEELSAQQAALQSITEVELEQHLRFLAADEMEGRENGEAGLYKAAEYLAKQAREMGLKALDEDGDFIQEYTLIEKKQDFSNSRIGIEKRGEQIMLDLPFYFLNADTTHIDLEGEVVFAGYGIYSSADQYNSFEGVELKDKIVLVMNRGPLDENGESRLGGGDWASSRSWQYKLPGLAMRMPKAILIVMDPKSGASSLEEVSRSMARYFQNTRFVKELGDPRVNQAYGLRARVLFIHRDVAEAILGGTEHDLTGWQEELDLTMKPASIEIPHTKTIIRGRFELNEKPMPNVVGLIEGSDPGLKDEVIIYSAHFDHLGMHRSGEVYNGADDNASGTSALLEISEAFLGCRAELKRSVMMLWVSGEEIGLYGSKFYAAHPLIPLDMTVADINLDMVGAVRSKRDTGRIYGEKVSVMGMDSIGLIGGHQSSQLMEIHHEISASLGMVTDLRKNDPDHPYRYYYRSDHFSFAKNDIPVLFYSTGIHPDYHKVSDDLSRISYPKLRKVSELSFLVGYRLATMKDRIEVDNPYSSW